MVTLTDDGIGSDGLDADLGHFGTATMRARAKAEGGQLRIESKPGRRHGRRADPALRLVYALAPAATGSRAGPMSAVDPLDGGGPGKVEPLALVAADPG